jgi:hypothetical protein
VTDVTDVTLLFKDGEGPGEPRPAKWWGLPLERHTIERLASEYRQRFYAERDEAAVDDWLRQKLADEGVFPEFITTEFERVMVLVFAPLGRKVRE